MTAWSTARCYFSAAHVAYQEFATPTGLPAHGGTGRPARRPRTALFECQTLTDLSEQVLDTHEAELDKLEPAVERWTSGDPFDVETERLI
jgi:hypothetical protein